VSRTDNKQSLLRSKQEATVLIAEKLKQLKKEATNERLFPAF